MATPQFKLIWKIYYYVDIVKDDKDTPLEVSYFSFDNDDAKTYFSLSGNNTTEINRLINSHTYQLHLFNSGITTGDTVMYFPWMTQNDINNLQRNNYAATGETIIKTSVSADGYFTKKNYTEHDEAPTMTWSCYYTIFNDKPQQNNEIEVKTPTPKSIRLESYPTVTFIFVDSDMLRVSNVDYLYNTNLTGVLGNTGSDSYISNIPGNIDFIRYGRRGFQTIERSLSLFDPNSSNYESNPVLYLTLLSDGEIASNEVLDNLFSTSLVNTYLLPYNENYSNNQKRTPPGQSTPTQIANAFNSYNFYYSTIAQENSDLTLRVSDYRTNSLPNELEEQIDEFNSYVFSNTGTLNIQGWTGSGMTNLMYCPAMSSYTQSGIMYTWNPVTNQHFDGMSAITTDVWDENNPQTFYSSGTGAYGVLMRYWYDRPNQTIVNKYLGTNVSGTICTINGINANYFGVFSPKINIIVSGWMSSAFHSTAYTTANCSLILKDVTNNSIINSEIFPLTNCGMYYECDLLELGHNNQISHNSDCRYSYDQYASHILAASGLNSNNIYSIDFELSINAQITNKNCCDDHPFNGTGEPGRPYWMYGYFTCAMTYAYVSIDPQQIIYGYN